MGLKKDISSDKIFGLPFMIGEIYVPEFNSEKSQ